MSDEQAFLEAICATPEDDTPRLVYADWLTERDQPGDSERAEFIRIQCRLAAIDDLCGGFYDDVGNFQAYGPSKKEERARLLPKQYRLFWRKEQWLDSAFPFWRQLELFVGTWRRGFVEEVRLYPADWCRYADAIQAATPLRQVTLTDWLRIHWAADRNKVDLYVPYDNRPFQTLPHVDWNQLTKDNHFGRRGGVRGWSWLAYYLWPGLIFHGPDFPEQMLVAGPDDKGILP